MGWQREVRLVMKMAMSSFIKFFLVPSTVERLTGILS